MSIKVGKKWDKGAIYIGRGSVLGNPFVMKDASQTERDRVCDAYALWLKDKILAKDPVVLSELTRISKLALKDEVVLGCFCSPMRCHGDFIKQIIEHHNK